MFYNVSNHPSTKWSEKQSSAAGNDIVDIQFPNVSPALGRVDIMELAQKFIHDNRLDMVPRGSSVLVQGESTLQFHLVQKLKASGVKVVAACSARETQEVRKPNKSITKTSILNFIQFREY